MALLKRKLSFKQKREKLGIKRIEDNRKLFYPKRLDEGVINPHQTLDPKKRSVINASKKKWIKIVTEIEKLNSIKPKSRMDARKKQEKTNELIKLLTKLDSELSKKIDDIEYKRMKKRGVTIAKQVLNNLLKIEPNVLTEVKGLNYKDYVPIYTSYIFYINNFPNKKLENLKKGDVINIFTLASIRKGKKKKS